MFTPTRWLQLHIWFLGPILLSQQKKNIQWKCGISPDENSQQWHHLYVPPHWPWLAAAHQIHLLIVGEKSRKASVFQEATYAKHIFTFSCIYNDGERVEWVRRVDAKIGRHIRYADVLDTHSSFAAAISICLSIALSLNIHLFSPPSVSFFKLLNLISIHSETIHLKQRVKCVFLKTSKQASETYSASAAPSPLCNGLSSLPTLTDGHGSRPQNRASLIPLLFTYWCRQPREAHTRWHMHALAHTWMHSDMWMRTFMHTLRLR